MKCNIQFFILISCFFFNGSESVYAGKRKHIEEECSPDVVVKRLRGENTEEERRIELFVKEVRKLFQDLFNYILKCKNPILPSDLIKFYIINISEMLKNIELLPPSEQLQELNWIVENLWFLVKKMQNSSSTFSNSGNKRLRELANNEINSIFEECFNREHLDPASTLPGFALFNITRHEFELLNRVAVF